MRPARFNIDTRNHIISLSMFASHRVGLPSNRNFYDVTILVAPKIDSSLDLKLDLKLELLAAQSLHHFLQGHRMRRLSGTHFMGQLSSPNDIETLLVDCETLIYHFRLRAFIS